MNNLLRKIDLTSLRLFVAACQEGNIARAAARELIAPSAVSRRISEIEEMIGLPIILREPRGISVTPVGQTVLKCAQEIIGSIETLEAELSRFYSGAKGKVKVVANLGSIIQFLPEDIAEFQRIFPDVDIEIEEQLSHEVIRTVQEMGADFGICNDIEGVHELQHLPYRTDFLGVVFPKGHWLDSANRVELRDLIHENFIEFRQESTLSQRIAKAAAELNVKLNVKIRMNSLDAMCRMVQVGMGIAIVPCRIGKIYTNTLGIGMIRLDEKWSERRSIVVFRAHSQLNATAKTLVKLLTEAA